MWSLGHAWHGSKRHWLSATVQGTEIDEASFYHFDFWEERETEKQFVSTVHEGVYSHGHLELEYIFFPRLCFKNHIKK